MKKLLVFTGGGMTRALNPTLYGIISAAKKNNIKVLGGIHGWACLLDEGKIIDLSDVNIELIKNIGGSFLRSSRTNPFNISDGIKQVKNNLKRLDIDYIVAIGGDDTNGAARNLWEKEKIKIIGCPKTIDNDLSATYWTPGFPSAAEAISEFVSRVKRDAAYGLKRIFVIETLGGHAGWVAAASSYGGADVILPPEKKFNLEKVLKIIKKKYEENHHFAVVVLTNETHFDKNIGQFKDTQKDNFGIQRHEFVAIGLKQEIEKKYNLPVKALMPGHHVEAGNPSPIDQQFAIELGEKAIELIKNNKFGYMPCIKRPNWKSIKIIVDSIELKKVVGKGNYRKLTSEYFDFNNLQVKNKFYDYMEPILGQYSQPDKEYYNLQKLLRNTKGL